MKTLGKNFSMRMAVPEDAPEILAIYEPYIQKTVITFEYEVPTVEAFRQRMEGIIGSYPYLVCEMDGKIVAYAYAHRFKERAAYQWDAELSVYVDENCTGMGMGTALYQALIEILKCQHVKNAYALVTSPNKKSEALHTSMGFTLEGICRKTGYKMGKWLDVSSYVKTIGAHDPEPEEIIPCSAVGEERIAAILTDSLRQGAFTLYEHKNNA